MDPSHPTDSGELRKHHREIIKQMNQMHLLLMNAINVSFTMANPEKQ